MRGALPDPDGDGRGGNGRSRGPIEGADRGRTGMGVAIAGQQYLWPNRTVAFVVDPAMPDPQRAFDAVAHWNQHGRMRFIARTDESDYVRIDFMAGAARSAVGRQGGEQDVAIGEDCPVGSIIHELGHAVGLWHEQCRSDRDQWVRIEIDNILPECMSNFDLKINFDGLTDHDSIDLGAYDYGSIMHYRTFAADDFAYDPTMAVITPLRPIPPGVEIGQRQALSAGDIAAVEELYQGIALPGD